jgi:sugar/nucleoside kinase (ribokinase family)
MMHGLFVGMTTLDLIYRAIAPPQPNQKLVASDYIVSAGGPATNAAVAFAHLGNQSTILSAIGSHPMTHLIVADLQQCGVGWIDLDPARTESPPVSSIIVTEATGDRAIISINTTKLQATAAQIPADVLHNVDIVLLDGHQLAVSRAIAQQAKMFNIPVVLDGGSWKPGLESLLPLVNYAVCSTNFYPPHCNTQADVVAHLKNLRVSHIAITGGEQPIWYDNSAQTGTIPVPKIQPIDTLGAGDIFHGAFCHFILQTHFVEALAQSAEVAARSCLHFGTRQWMKD